ERARKVGGTTIRSIGHIAKLQRIKDNDKSYVSAIDMLLELMNDNKAQIHSMREAHEVADKHEDVATASLLENFIDEAEKRCWFLLGASGEAERGGHWRGRAALVGRLCCGWPGLVPAIGISRAGAGDR